MGVMEPCGVYHPRIRQSIMQRQTARAEERYDKTEKARQRREIFCRVSSRRAQETHSFAVRVGDLDAHPTLSHGGLRRRAFQTRSIEPPETDGHQPGQSTHVLLQQLPLLHSRLVTDVIPCAWYFDGQGAEGKQNRDGHEIPGAWNHIKIGRA